MSVTAASGHPDYSGTFIPELWSTVWNYKLYKATVFPAIANRRWEGEIKKQGDVVKIRVKPDIIIRDYDKGGTLKVQRPESTIVELRVDKAKYFNAIEDDIDEVQSDLKLLAAWNEDATEQMKIAIDKDGLQNIYADVHASNAGSTAGADTSAYDMGTTGTPVTVDKTNILEKIVDCGSVLDEQSVTDTGRWLLFPPLFINMVKVSDLKDASLAGDGTSILRNGRVGMIDRFELFRTRQLKYVSADSAFHCLFGHKMGLAFAAQMTEMDSLKVESTFGRLIRGLQVYGYKVNLPAAIGDLYAAKA